MGQNAVNTLLAFSSIILFVFVTGLIIFFFQYRNRRAQHEREKALIEEKHKSDLLETQLKSRQQTMQFIGQEIHDSVTQKLTLASIYTHQLEFDQQDKIIIEKISGVNKIISDSLLELRDLSRSLTDTQLQDTPLPELIRLEAGRVNATGFCKVIVSCDAEVSINTSEKSTLIRVIQEFFQNSVKHSECNEIKVQVQNQTNGLVLFLTDNGKGFNPSDTNGGGIGISNMKRRIQFIGGTFQLNSGIGTGTRVDIFVPLKMKGAGAL
jgi:signal transduction histidine kinase